MFYDKHYDSLTRLWQSLPLECYSQSKAGVEKNEMIQKHHSDLSKVIGSNLRKVACESSFLKRHGEDKLSFVNEWPKEEIQDYVQMSWVTEKRYCWKKTKAWQEKEYKWRAKCLLVDNLLTPLLKKWKVRGSWRKWERWKPSENSMRRDWWVSGMKKQGENQM